MADNTEPGVFVKGNLVRVADNRSEAVALVFDGFKRQAEVKAPAEPVAYDPSTDSVEGVLAYLARPEVSEDERDRVIAAELDGKARSTLLNQL